MTFWDFAATVGAVATSGNTPLWIVRVLTTYWLVAVDRANGSMLTAGFSEWWRACLLAGSALVVSSLLFAWLSVDELLPKGDVK